MTHHSAPSLQAPAIHGQGEAAKIFEGRAKKTQLALVDGDVGLVIALGGKPRIVLYFMVEDGRIAEISLIADARGVKAMDMEF